MSRLLRIDEAATKFFDGELGTLQHSIASGLVRAVAAFADFGEWVWAEGQSTVDHPESGKTRHAKWTAVEGNQYRLEGRFYIADRAAYQIACGKPPARIVVAESEDEEWGGGLSFMVTKTLSPGDLRLIPSFDNHRFRQPEDEWLDEMADAIPELSSEPLRIARFQAAAQAGGGRMDIDEMHKMGEWIKLLQQFKLVTFTQAAIREEYRSERASGGKAKAANAKPNPEIAKAIECARKHPGLSATQIKTRAKLRASDRTIRKWLAESC